MILNFGWLLMSLLRLHCASSHSIEIPSRREAAVHFAKEAPYLLLLPFCCWGSEEERRRG
jgi:hypothetical protein